MFNISIGGDKSKGAPAGIKVAGIDTKIVAGLGNPKGRYENTPHNAGFMFIDYLAELYGSPNPKWQKTRLFNYLKAGNIVLVRPNTFMNNSGQAIGKSLNYFGINPRGLLVVHDDSDIEFGKYKFSFGRGSAGHHGIESIMKTLKTPDFHRLRIGIRQDGQKAGDFVLKNMPDKTLTEIKKLFSEIETSHFKS